jgi:hypothetical protein
MLLLSSDHCLGSANFTTAAMVMSQAALSELLWMLERFQRSVWNYFVSCDMNPTTQILSKPN